MDTDWKETPTFFLTNGACECVYFIDIGENREFVLMGKKTNYEDYSLNTKITRIFAPTAIHDPGSALICAKRDRGFVSRFPKIFVFGSFQIS